MLSRTDQVGVKRIALEHHRDAAFRGFGVGHLRPPMCIVPEVASSSPAIMPQQGGFAAAGRADEDAEFAGLDGQVDALDHIDRAKAFA